MSKTKVYTHTTLWYYMGLQKSECAPKTQFLLTKKPKKLQSICNERDLK